ncbi:hypothetical protein OC713_02605 [Sweet potato little leaf phytoplasma]|uniref:hypothetical protein n=1 Tax=Candidatus Phytoplasma australasiaticum TaxID=2754999 RepID=UPI00271335BC|nr:hypothetical protein [Sweet potato little leaf phytoplasma]MDO7987395.1 hypothetical protein [Sweet potato little leaf phytoplasma]
MVLAVMPELGCSEGAERVLDVNRVPAVAMIPAEETDERTAALSSPNSTVSSFQMDFGVRNGGGSRSKRSSDLEMETERASSRISDDEENGSARKKLRLSKEQSAFLEESFKEHSTLNPVSQNPQFMAIFGLFPIFISLLKPHIF